MAMGVPVVTTSLGFEALDAVAGRDILVANDPKQFAEEVIRLVKDRDLRQYIAQNARKLVEEKYDWSSIVERLEAVYESIKPHHR
jgi:glycosyltransferase involved in cell wall biosynthesis